MNTTFAAAALLAASLSLTAGAAEPKRVMAFDDSITWGWKPVVEGVPSDRFPASVRWPGAMQSALGDGYVRAWRRLSDRQQSAGVHD